MAKITQVLDDLYLHKDSIGNASLGVEIGLFLKKIFIDGNLTAGDMVDMSNSILAKISEGGLLGNAIAIQTIKV